jgi:transposase
MAVGGSLVGGTGAAAAAAADGLDPAAVRALPTDAFAALLLRLGRYRVDLATGAVISGRTGRPMAPQRNPRTGYDQVLLRYRPAARSVTVHRLVALAAWGVEAVRGRHIVHRDDDRTHNAAANLALVDPSARNRGPVAPCARCGAPGGRARAPGGAGPPARVSGTRFGIAGLLCAGCYDSLRRERRRRARAEAPPAAPAGPRTGELVRLDAAARRALLDLVAGERRARVAWRYRALLLLSDGQPPAAVIAALGCCRASVYGWAAAWRRAGAAGVCPAAARGGRGRALAGGGEAVLDACLRAAPPAFGHPAAGWTVALLLTELRAAGYAVGPRTVYRTLHRLGWRGTRHGFVRSRPDPAAPAPDLRR